MNSSRKYTVYPRDEYADLRQRYMEKTMSLLSVVLGFALLGMLLMIVAACVEIAAAMR